MILLSGCGVIEKQIEVIREEPPAQLLVCQSPIRPEFPLNTEKKATAAYNDLWWAWRDCWAKLNDVREFFLNP